MSRPRFSRRFGGGVVQAATRPGDMGDLFDWRHTDAPAAIIEARKALMPTRCLVPSCTRPTLSRVYTTNRQQVGACGHPLHQALMKRKAVVRTWYWEGT